METIQLSPSEKALLQGNHNFSKAKARYVRYRINKKIRLQGRDFTSLGITTDLSSRNDIIGRDAAATPQQQLQPRRWGSSLVRIPTDCAAANEHNERVKNEGKVKEKRKWADRELNSGSPPCQGGILTRLDHRPNIQWKNLLPKYML